MEPNKFACLSWPTNDVKESEEAAKVVNQLLVAGFEIVSHTTVVVNKTVIQTLVMVKPS